MYENSDKLACLIDKGNNGIILNDQVFHYESFNNSISDFKNKIPTHSGNDFIVFYESNRKSNLNDILKCHDIKYI